MVGRHLRQASCHPSNQDERRQKKVPGEAGKIGLFPPDWVLVNSTPVSAAPAGPVPSNWLMYEAQQKPCRAISSLPLEAQHLLSEFVSDDQVAVADLKGIGEFQSKKVVLLLLIDLVAAGLGA